MSDKGKSDQQIEREEKFRVAHENTRGYDSEAYQLKLERKREIARTYRVTLSNDEQLATRAGYSDVRRQRDFKNRSHAYRAAHDDDERMEFLVFNRRSDQYNQRVREGYERRIAERNEGERVERERGVAKK